VRRPRAVASGGTKRQWRRSPAWTCAAHAQTRFFTGGHGTFAVTDEEDLPIARALSALARAGRANASRLVVLRGISDYTCPPAADELTTWFWSESHMVHGAFDSLVRAGMPIVRQLTEPVVRAPAAMRDARTTSSSCVAGSGVLLVPRWVVGTLCAGVTSGVVLVLLCAAMRRAAARRAHETRTAMAKRHMELIDEVAPRMPFT
jgi:hypothetical protein